ncbi:secreted RxLR effector protein 161-like [Primulina eburnea]|uniref:secreted RxLR effector protein 161-like n=1 Tax=Primulina eburnea TaxID=1245227 RepID=UPI003C6C5CB3
MEESKRVYNPMSHGVTLSKSMCPKTEKEIEIMSRILYASSIDNIIYVKDILQYLRRTKNLFLVYGSGELKFEGYTDSSFQSDVDDSKLTSAFVFKLNCGVVSWKSSKQDTTVDSTTKAEYIAALAAANEGVWMKNSFKRWV